MRAQKQPREVHVSTLDDLTGEVLYRAGEAVPAGRYLRTDSAVERVIDATHGDRLPATCDGTIAHYRRLDDGAAVRSRPLSRRGFLTGMLGAASLTALAACTPATTPTPEPAKPAATAPTPTTAPAKPAATAATPTTAPAKTGGTTPTAATAASTKTVQGVGLIKGPHSDEAKALNGAGATFPAVLYTKWFSEYEKVTGVKVNYQSIGSGGGIKSISDQTVDFGATDGPMTDEQMKAAKGGEILHIPMALGAVVPTYNVPGVTQPLKFTGETLAGIFLGEITKWNDPKLLADNPDAGLPDADIVVVHRSDGSGTTFIWVDYLSAVSEKWKSTVGKGTSVNWPVGLGGKGNEGVAGEVKQNPNSIGYVELIYAVQNKLGFGHVRNQDGNFVEPSLETVTAAAAGVAGTIAPDLRASIVNAPGEKAYPISGFTWLLVYQSVADKAKAIALTRMLWWAIHDAQKFNSELGYAPLPEGIVKKAEEKVLAITSSGQPAFPGS